MQNFAFFYSLKTLKLAKYCGFSSNTSFLWEKFSHRLINNTERTLDVVFSRFRDFSFTRTLRQKPKGVTRMLSLCLVNQRSMRVTSLGFCISVISDLSVLFLIYEFSELLELCFRLRIRMEEEHISSLSTKNFRNRRHTRSRRNMRNRRNRNQEARKRYLTKCYKIKMFSQWLELKKISSNKCYDIF